MPGAPNRPPETAPPPPPPTPAAEPPDRKVLRRLAPSRIALLLDAWKGAPAPDLTTPFEKAEAAYLAGDFPSAANALDLLSVRFAEPRWPTLPDPFRRLRVPIPAPTPPHWDPDHALSPEEKQLKRARREADDQLALADGVLAWASTHGVDLTDVRPVVEEARVLLTTEGGSPAYYERIDRVWMAVCQRAPKPKVAGARPAPPPAAADAEAGEA